MSEQPSASQQLAAWNERLTELRERLTERERLDARLASLQAEHSRLLAKVDELSEQLGSEGRDVERLEKVTLSSLLHRLLGDREKLLDRERQELLAAELRFDEASTELAGVEKRLRELAARREALAGVEEEHARAVAERDRLVEAELAARYPELGRIAEELGRHRALRKEIGEAVAAGRMVKTVLEGTLATLGRARNLGLMDQAIGFGQGLQEYELSSAESDLYLVQQALADFRRELDDVRRLAQQPLPGAARKALEIDPTDFIGFTDGIFHEAVDIARSQWTADPRFLPSTFMPEASVRDLIVHQRVDDSRVGLARLQRSIGAALDWLAGFDRALEERCRALETERERVISGR